MESTGSALPFGSTRFGPKCHRVLARFTASRALRSSLGMPLSRVFCVPMSLPPYTLITPENPSRFGQFQGQLTGLYRRKGLESVKFFPCMINTDVYPGPFLVTRKGARSGPMEGSDKDMVTGMLQLGNEFFGGA